MAYQHQTNTQSKKSKIKTHSKNCVHNNIWGAIKVKKTKHIWSPTYPTLVMIFEGEKLARPWGLVGSAEAGVGGGSGVLGGKGKRPPSSLGVFIKRPELKSVTILIGELLLNKLHWKSEKGEIRISYVYFMLV